MSYSAGRRGEVLFSSGSGPACVQGEHGPSLAIRPVHWRNAYYAGPVMIVREIIRTFGGVVGRLRIAYFRKAGIAIGKDCMISSGAKLDVSGGRIIIGDRCTITHGCIILSHDRAKKRIDPHDKGQGVVRLGNDVFVGVNSVILRDVTIGDYSIIAVGSVVTKDVPPQVVVAGNPARVIKEFSSTKSLV